MERKAIIATVFPYVLKDKTECQIQVLFNLGTIDLLLSQELIFRVANKMYIKQLLSNLHLWFYHSLPKLLE